MTVADDRTAKSADDPDATRLLPHAEQPSGLPRGTRLRDVEIEGVIGEGGFSIVYAAVDLNLRRKVAVKEYMPAVLAKRRDDRTVAPRRDSDRESFELGRRSFLNEARLLAQFDHPALVKVHQFWEDNGTAYMAMPLYEGCTLKRWLQQRNNSPSENELLDVVAPLLDALVHLHARNIFHRDIAPDNVLVLDDARPVLLDFGAARQVLADSNAALTAILKPSYAPIEQYADMGHLRQGPWTDVYAFCAVLYFGITGKAPPAAVARSIEDKMTPATKAGAGRYSPRLLRAIDAGLAVRPEARPQSIAELRERLGLLAEARPATLVGDTYDGSRRGVRAKSAMAIIISVLFVLGALAAWSLGAFDNGGSAARRPTPEQASPVLSGPAISPGTTPVNPAQSRDAMPPVEQSTMAEPRGSTPPSTAEVAPQRAEKPAPVSEQVREPAKPSGQRPRVEGAAAGRGSVTSMPERCLRILQRMQLGEAPSQEDKHFLQQECK